MSDQELQTPDQRKGFFGGFASTAVLVWDFLKIVLIALIVIIPIRYFIFQPFIVSGSSMEPNFSNGEYLIIDELTYHFKDPSRGDVVVLRFPNPNSNPADDKQFYIKRIVGLPGEKIVIDKGKVMISNDGFPQGASLDEPYLPNQSLTYPHDVTIVGGSKTLILGPDEYFMLGDNRLASSDSRDWGVLRRDEMIGKVFLRALPLNEFQVYAKTQEYSF